jgi:hypothetical protein
VFFLDLFGMSPRPAAAADALRLLLRALGVADEQIPEDVPGRASVYRSLLRDRQALVILDNAGSEEQVRPLLPGDGASRAVITARRLLAGLEGVRRLVLGPLSPPEATELLTGILGPRAARDGVPAGTEALGGAVTEPAWRSKPSWYLVTTDDQMIPPAAQRAMGERAKATVTETPGSHAVFVSRPAVVAAVISQAAQS